MTIRNYCWAQERAKDGLMVGGRDTHLPDYVYLLLTMLIFDINICSYILRLKR